LHHARCNDSKKSRFAPAAHARLAGRARICPAAERLQFQVAGAGRQVDHLAARREQVGGAPVEGVAIDTLRQRGPVNFERPFQLFDLGQQDRGRRADRAARRAQASARQAEPPSALQGDEDGAQPGEEACRIPGEQPIVGNGHPVEPNGTGPGSAQAGQVGMRMHPDALRGARNRIHGRMATGSVGRDHDDDAFRVQVGGPGYRAGKSVRGVVDLQAIEAGQRPHGIGQAGGAGQRTVQQARQESACRMTLGALQQAFDHGALGPVDESGAKRMPGQFRHDRDRGAGRCAGAAALAGHADAQQACSRQHLQQVFAPACFGIERLGMRIEPGGQGVVQLESHGAIEPSGSGKREVHSQAEQADEDGHAEQRRDNHVHRIERAVGIDVEIFLAAQADEGPGNRNQRTDE